MTFPDVWYTAGRIWDSQMALRVDVDEADSVSSEWSRTLPLHGTGRHTLLLLARPQLDAVAAVAVVPPPPAEPQHSPAHTLHLRTVTYNVYIELCNKA